MKKLFILLIGILPATVGRSQSILDLSEQLAFDIQKLASIKSTLQDMVKGFDRLKSGYTQIRDVVKDNFNLHKTYLDALWVLSPAVRADPGLSKTLATAIAIVNAWRTATARYATNPFFTPNERSYITATLDALLRHCNQAVEELTLITTDNELRMTDAQRLAALDRIAVDIGDDTAFLQHFNNSLAIEAARRQREANDITTLKSLYGLPD
ncbi:MAG TPA: hypothetical protein VGM89_02175 [Puia sp.]|jgi:hypothetical protein